MECSSKYRSLKEETMKLEHVDNKEHFDSEITIKEEWNKDEDFEDTPSESKGPNIEHEDNKECFDLEITIKEEWNKDEDFEDTPSESKGPNMREKSSENWSDFDNGESKPHKCTECNQAFEFSKDLSLTDDSNEQKIP
jgi:hypothetical protein